MKSLSPSRFATGSADLPTWARSASGRAIAVLGADGYIGSRVVCAALAAGARVTGVCVKDPWRLAHIRDPRLVLKPVEGGGWWLDDAFLGLTRLLGQVEAVVLLYYRRPDARTDAGRLDEELRLNAATVERIAKAAASAGVTLVFASSADVYGPWLDGLVAEDTPARPVTPYAKAKLEAERLVADAFGAGGGYVIERIATVYGPGENGPRAIPSFVRAFYRGVVPVVHGDGTDVRDYVHVDDVAAASLNAAVGPCDAGVVNIGSGVGRTTLDVLRAVAAALGAEPLARYEPSRRPPSRLVLDPRRACRALGFEPRREFERAVRDEALWLRERLAASE
jgi:UDP-glucose 4-epimerase